MDVLARLTQEHRHLLALAQRLESSAADRGWGFESLARQLFEDFYRHGLEEENGLFRAILPKSREAGLLLDELKTEHKRIVEFSYQLKKALENVQEDPDRLQHVSRSLRELLAAHFGKEERVLFPQAALELGPESLRSLGRADEQAGA